MCAFGDEHRGRLTEAITFLTWETPGPAGVPSYTNDPPAKQSRMVNHTANPSQNHRGNHKVYLGNL